MSKSQGTGYRSQGAEPMAAQGVQVDGQAIPLNASTNDLVQIEPKKPTLAEVRAKLANQKGKKFWRSVDELANSPDFAELVNQEFPSQASEWIDPVSRRNFLKVMGASMALAGLAGCTKQPDEPIYAIRNSRLRIWFSASRLFCVGVSVCVGCGPAADQE